MGEQPPPYVLTSLPPVISSHTRLLILGSFPGAASLRAQEYYAHPRNHFWFILSAVWPGLPGRTNVGNYQQRCDWLLDRGLGLWDVYSSCEREGSLDASIRNGVLNDFSSLNETCPQLGGIAHNGTESFKYASHSALLGLPTFKLPSTSPANASWSFDRKVVAWREVFEKCALI